MKKIAINGFGRIGRAVLKIILDEPGLGSYCHKRPDDDRKCGLLVQI